MNVSITPTNNQMPVNNKTSRSTASQAVFSSSNNGDDGQQQSAAKRKSNRLQTGIFTSRVVFLVCLAVVAAVLGYTAFRLLTDTEYHLASEQFEAFTESALDHAKKIADRQKLGLITLASVVEQSLPDSTQWPFVHINGFTTIAHNVMKTSSGMSMGLMPIVTPEQLTDFENYAYNVVMQGDAIVDKMYGFNETGGKYFYNETDKETWGVTYWGSPNKIFTPFYQHSSSDVLFLANWHSIEARGRLVDEMIACSQERAQEMIKVENIENPDFVPKECSVVTDIIDLRFKVPVGIPSAVSIQPIYPANNPTNMTGIITSAILWNDTLLDVFSNEVSGVDCVLKTDTQAFTYEIINGVVTLKGQGDLHDRDFDNYAQEVILSGPGQYSNSTPTYILTVYPNVKLFEVYETNNPTVALIGSVCIILFTSILFFLYDFFVRSEFHHKESLSKARRQFVRFISHEVRTPLNAVCMGLQLLQDENLIKLPASTNSTNDGNNASEPAGDTEELKRRYLEIAELQKDILTNAHSAINVLNDLLNYDKVESGTLRLELAVIPIFELIERTVSEFRQVANIKKIDLASNYEDAFRYKQQKESNPTTVVAARELPQEIKHHYVVGDEVRLRQVLRNLLSNALKFTPSQGKVFIRTVMSKVDTSSGRTTEFTLHSGESATYLNGGVLQLEVTDTGVGMSPDQLKNLFKEGVQFDVNKLQAGQGSGLGLYIAKGFMEGHGGSLTASSDGKGCGTTFTMTIPLYHIPTYDWPEHDESLRQIQWDQLDSLNILIVDDAHVNRKLLSRLLQNHGHVCDEAENGRLAVSRVEELMAEGKRFDSILMDKQMPEMDGCQAVKKLRAMGCDSFIVGITGTLFYEDVEGFRRSGANSVLPKPLDLRALMNVLIENGVADARET